MLMLCLVFAAAGPVKPGSGDVPSTDPTVAFGAAPIMLLFAPDGGAGFDFWGQDSFEKILTSWNSTNAGPLGPSGALNVIPHPLEDLMAVRACHRGARCAISAPRPTPHAASVRHAHVASRCAGKAALFPEGHYRHVGSTVQ